MDINPERITFDPFVLPHETPLDIFFRLSCFKCLSWHTGKRETLAGLSGGRLVYLLVYTYLYLAAMAGENTAFICTPTPSPRHITLSHCSTGSSQCPHSRAHVTAVTHATPSFWTKDLPSPVRARKAGTGTGHLSGFRCRSGTYIVHLVYLSDQVFPHPFHLSACSRKWRSRKLALHWCSVPFQVVPPIHWHMPSLSQHVYVLHKRF